LGAIPIANRIVVAPMSRKDADENGLPGAASIAYFAERASAGLIITGSVWIDPLGRGGAGIAGIHADAQARAWKLVADAVQAAGERIVLQPAHAGALLPADAAAFCSGHRKSAGPCRAGACHLD
jgi:N-ethylmaleimide reductase